MSDLEFSENKKQKYWSQEEALINIQKYCAFQERCHKDVRYKLIEHCIYGDLLEEIISDLISNNFLNEERFARAFTRGKFRMKQWGKNKIKAELKFRDVSPYCINESMKEIEDVDYINTLQLLIVKKDKTVSFKNKYDRLKKLSDFAVSKGYEYELINRVIHELEDE
ncbi:MAG: RecX family transcriptional regulator [Saprospiraceae bacterium]|jgi:regulatory protein|nr:RecX family transcriptional regulator [Saprospiraceae bacterium]MBL0027081.1 RecX family transcriptional regulator [Saprospiraceae bacterium]